MDQSGDAFTLGTLGGSAVALKEESNKISSLVGKFLKNHNSHMDTRQMGLKGSPQVV